jgi:hypothetical protein
LFLKALSDTKIDAAKVCAALLGAMRAQEAEHGSERCREDFENTILN